MLAAVLFMAADPEELLERLSRVMGGGGLRQWQTGGRLDPFGSGTSEAWARCAQRLALDATCTSSMHALTFYRGVPQLGVISFFLQNKGLQRRRCRHP